MRLLFLCGSIDPGKDGVGDYARRLARGCVARGHEAQLIGLSMTGRGRASWVIGMAGGPESVVETLGPMVWSAAERVLRERVSEFSPDWLSLQFVCWRFGGRGVVTGLGSDSGASPGRRRTGRSCFTSCGWAWREVNRGSAGFSDRFSAARCWGW